LNYWIKNKLEKFTEAFTDEYCKSIDVVVDVIASCFQNGNTRYLFVAMAAQHQMLNI